MKLSDNLRSIRKENNLSQEQLAEKLGVSRQAVSKWESGQSYPEMDKVLLICKLFNYNIDELMNENVKEVDESKQSKININKYIDDFFNFITKTVDMLSSMKFKEKLKCLVEQIAISIFLVCIFAIIGSIGSSILSGLTRGFNNNIYYFIRNIFESIYLIIALVLGITVLLHIFKIRYLDYYEVIQEDNNNENENTEIQDNVSNSEKNKIVLEKKKEKIIIRDPEHSQSKFLTGIIRIIIWCIKFIAVCIAVGFAFSFVGLVMTLVLSFLFIKTGLVFIGAFLGIISALIINFIILEILFNFVISKANKKHRIAIALIISLILAGASIGLVLIGITNFNYVEDSNINNEYEDTYEVQMTDNFYISSYYPNLEYIETESDEIKIVAKHSKYYKVNFVNENDTVDIHYMNDGMKTMEMIRDVIDDINNKEIRNYDIPTIYVYASKENITKMKQNETKIYEEQRQNEIIILENRVNELEETIEENEDIMESLNEQVKEKDDELKILQEEINNRE